ncbi:EAL domain-containing protein [Liquorilactobacillus hordei]|uniref:EAL domain-containing protein n=1 Tax=Liquorilactobacillus hordei TaxID=468911 RepID=UPI001CBBF2EB|nr:EAL domain-containing protein [Liquorilactobacillus hordei]MBZ2405699.1 c-di-GMP phosphodiesterase [Liquorilactobacillus hordei]
MKVKNEKCGERLLDTLFFCLQPIIKSDEEKVINEYEVLLRRTKDQKFPKDEFAYLTQNDKKNEQLMIWSCRKIQDFLEVNPQCTLWINLNHHQLSFKSTYVFLESLRKFKKNIKIEITEQIPESASNETGETIKRISKIKEMGYEIALDDVGMGMNTLAFVLANTNHIKRLKLSIVPFKTLSMESLVLLIKFWKLVANEAKVELVIEGIDSEKMRTMVHQAGVKMQQGFLWKSQFIFLY